MQPSPIVQQTTITRTSITLASTSLLTLPMYAAQPLAKIPNIRTTNQNQNTQSINNSLSLRSIDITTQKRKRDLNVNMTEEVKT